MAKLSFLLSCLFLISCSSGPCSNTPQRDPEALKASAGDAKTPSETVKVFKDTGEKQCAGGGQPLDKMKEVLVKNNIKVLEAVSQSDGKMHPQVCGATAGKIHVFTISKDQLKRATGLGFSLFR